MQDKYNCPICLVSWQDSCIRQLACSHTFHRSCLDEWEERSNACPCCRAPIKPKELALETTLDTLIKSLKSANKAIVKLRTITKDNIANEYKTQSSELGIVLEELTNNFVHVSSQLLPHSNELHQEENTFQETWEAARDEMTDMLEETWNDMMQEATVTLEETGGTWSRTILDSNLIDTLTSVIGRVPGSINTEQLSNLYQDMYNTLQNINTRHDPSSPWGTFIRDNNGDNGDNGDSRPRNPE